MKFFPALLLLFIALKLTGHIAWSWWWVLAPLYAPLVAILGTLAVVYVALVIVGLCEKDDFK